MANNNKSSYKLSIVIPVYRSALILPKLVTQILAEMRKQGLENDFELLLINDASPDDSWAVIQSLAQINPFVKGLSLRRNAGQHNAIMAGLNNASGEVVIMMDDDLQHPPQAIGDMLQAVNQGYDVCYTHYNNRKHAMWKRLGSQFNDWVASHLLDKPKGLYLSSFKAMRKEVVNEVIKYDGPYAYLDGLILDVTSSITTIYIEHQSRDEGDSNYNFRRLLSLWMRMATSFSVVPLRLATYIGFILATISLAAIVFVVVRKILHPEVPSGWTSLTATILFIGGVQTVFIGLIGEYLGRAYLKLNGKPQFVVRAKTWLPEDANSAMYNGEKL